MNINEYIKRVFKAKVAKNSSDFSSFLSDIPLTHKQQQIEACQKLGVSIYIDDPSEQSAGVYANLRAVASEAELECRLNAEKAIMNAEKATKLSKWAIVISLLALLLDFIWPTISFFKSAI